MIGGPANEGQWRAALADFGAFDVDGFRLDAIDIQGLVYGYVYLNLSQSRTFGGRMPGVTPDFMDRTYLGDVQAPHTYRIPTTTGPRTPSGSSRRSIGSCRRPAGRTSRNTGYWPTSCAPNARTSRR